MKLLKNLLAWKDLKWKNLILADDIEKLENEMVRLRMENRAYDLELGTATNKIVRLRCERNNLLQAIALDQEIKMEQRKQWAREHAPELMEMEDFTMDLKTKEDK